MLYLWSHYMVDSHLAENNLSDRHLTSIFADDVSMIPLYGQLSFGQKQFDGSTFSRNIC
jgi:hypothetical protein